MTLRNLVLSVAAVAASAFALASTSANAATIIPVGTFTPSEQFYLTGGSTPTSSVITANFGATIGGKDTSFDDIFEFTIPQNGLGSGSLSTSFSSMLNELTVNSVTIDGKQFTATQAAAGVSGIKIVDGVMNTLEVIGETSPKNVEATYSGTLTFVASAAPEPATWLLMIGGLGAIGLMMRRRNDALAII